MSLIVRYSFSLVYEAVLLSQIPWIFVYVTFSHSFRCVLCQMVAYTRERERECTALTTCRSSYEVRIFISKINRLSFS